MPEEATQMYKKENQVTWFHSEQCLHSHHIHTEMSLIKVVL